MNRQRFLLPALLLLTVVRLGLLPLRELAPMESYAALCSERAAIWHVMLGPVLPWLVKLTTTIFGINEFGVRFASPFLMLGASWLLWRMARGLFDANVASWCVVLFNVLPVVNLASVTMTPMTLAIVGAIVLLYALRLALHRNHPQHLWWWGVVGAQCLLFFTDWPLFLAAGAAAGTLMITARGRRAVQKWPVMPILAGSVGLAVTVLFAWASEHSWIVFHRFTDQETHGWGGTFWRLFLVQPVWALAALIWGLQRSVRQKPGTYPVAYLYAFGIPLFLLDEVSVYGSHWPQFGYSGWVAPTALLLAYQYGTWEAKFVRLKTAMRTGFLLLSIIQSCLVMNTDVARDLGVAWKLTQQKEGDVAWWPQDPSHELVGWRSVAEELNALILQRQGRGEAPSAILADRWQIAAPLAVLLKDVPLHQRPADCPAVQVFTKEGELSPFSLWSTMQGSAAPVLYVTDHADAEYPTESVSQVYPKQKLVAWFKVTHHGMALRTWKVFACSKEMAEEK